ncbi:MAG TPA: DinB family protein [Vicinamibacterales bacterium]|nr:DinB family protein [Vicinamibacterales bacterium]
MVPRAVRPAHDEAADYYFKYIDLVPDGDVCAILEAQRTETLAFLRNIPEERSRHKYAADKWSVSEVVAHLNDCERLFAFRAFWFARGFESPLPSFDQEVAARHGRAGERDFSTHVEEFSLVRGSTLDLFEHLPADAWMRRGIASDNPFTVRALAFIAAGHVIHHARILKERYL